MFAFAISKFSPTTKLPETIILLINFPHGFSVSRTYWTFIRSQGMRVNLFCVVAQCLPNSSFQELINCGMVLKHGLLSLVPLIHFLIIFCTRFTFYPFVKNVYMYTWYGFNLVNFFLLSLSFGVLIKTTTLKFPLELHHTFLRVELLLSFSDIAQNHAHTHTHTCTSENYVYFKIMHFITQTVNW